MNVRAVNGASMASATDGMEDVIPGVPTAPRDLTADSKTEEITLSWTAPAYAGTPALTRYEYRYTSVAGPDGDAGLA